MSPSMATVTVHYRRHRRDYQCWQLWLWCEAGGGAGAVMPLVAPPRAPPEDAFGALFRVAVDAVPWLATCDRLGILPRTPNWAERDAPERIVEDLQVELAAAADHIEGLHLYIVQGDPGVHLSPRKFRLPSLSAHDGAVKDDPGVSPDRTRFVALVLDTAAAPLTAIPSSALVTRHTCPWLVVTPVFPGQVGNQVPQDQSGLEVFPAPFHGESDSPAIDSQLFIIDRACFPHEAVLCFTPVTDHDEASKALVETKLAAAWRPSDSDSVVLVPGSLALFSEDDDENTLSVEEKLIAHAHSVQGLCRILQESSLSQQSTVDPFFPSSFAAETSLLVEQPHTLLIHYHMLHDTDIANLSTLSVCGARNAAIAPTVDKVSMPSPRSFVFAVDLALFTPEELQQGLKITPLRSRSGAPMGPTAVWKPHLHGMVVALGEGGRRVMHIKDATIHVHYHRFDHLNDWKDWELHVWSDSKSQATDSIRTVIKPSRLLSEGVVLFNFECFAIFPLDAVICLQPIKLRPAHMITDVVDLSVSSEICDGNIVDRAPLKRDVIRKFQRASYRATSSPDQALTVHFVQASTEILSRRPSRTAISSQRWIKINYCRYLDSDHDGWDLWTWDNDDPASSRCAVTPTNGTGDTDFQGLEFMVDRANYGSGRDIHVLPRRGGNAWLAKDEPARLLQHAQLFGDEPSCSTRGSEESVVDNSCAPSVIITQNTSLVLRNMDECRTMLSACVSSENTILIHSPIPFEWLKHGPHDLDLQPTVLRFADITRAAETLRLDVREQLSVSPNDLKCCDDDVFVHCREIIRQSPVDILYIVDESIHLNEDYCVERSLLFMHRFCACQLKWREYDSLDEYYYPGPLGWEYTPSQCIFRCFAPTADVLYVVLYKTASGGSGEHIAMRKIPEGCWKAIVRGDLKGMYYKLRAEGEDKRLFPGVEVIDPYSRCNTSHVGRGYIFGHDVTPIAPRPSVDAAHTIVYELHVRDATIDPTSGVEHRGKYLGLTEHGTHLKGNCILNKNDSSLKSRASLYERSQPSDADMESSMDAETRTESFSHELLDATKCQSPSERLAGLRAENITGFDSKMNDDSPSLSTLYGLNPMSTALDHIVEMGVTAVQIMPIQDFDNDELDDNMYNWGYMPVHFNSPDGWYASRTDTEARVTEFKQTVDAFHRSGLKVIMDVVYNHTAEDSNEFNLDARFSFNGLAPRYYYRNCGNTPYAYTGESTCCQPVNGSHCGTCASNGSGCGNEFRSESRMGRKFILDSLKYWVSEYQVDGFRFDLLGLIDVETLTLAAAELHAIDPNIILYGEPWCGGLTPIQTTEKGSQRSRGFGVFNNTFRDALRGSPFNIEETFLMDGGRVDEVKKGIMGSIDDFADSPLETINYVECHDNRTLWDHMRSYVQRRTDDISFSDTDLVRIHKLAALIVLTSQGIPMMQIGQEMCRTKFDDENSYKSPDAINMVRWEKKQEKLDVVMYYHGLIYLRRSRPDLFSISSASEIRSRLQFFEDIPLTVPPRCIGYRISGIPISDPVPGASSQSTAQELMGSLSCEENACWRSVVVLLNPNPTDASFVLPDAVKFQHWILVVNAEHAGTHPLQQPVHGNMTVAGRSGAVLRQCSPKENERALLELRMDSITDAFVVPTDEVISAYALGLSLQRTAVEQKSHEALVLRREEFLEARRS